MSATESPISPTTPNTSRSAEPAIFARNGTIDGRDASEGPAIGFSRAHASMRARVRSNSSGRLATILIRSTTSARVFRAVCTATGWSAPKQIATRALGQVVLDLCRECQRVDGTGERIGLKQRLVVRGNRLHLPPQRVIPHRGVVGSSPDLVGRSLDVARHADGQRVLRRPQLTRRHLQLGGAHQRRLGRTLAQAPASIAHRHTAPRRRVALHLWGLGKTTADRRGSRHVVTARGDAASPTPTSRAAGFESLLANHTLDSIGYVGV